MRPTESGTRAIKNKNDTFSHTFLTAGSFPYFYATRCLLRDDRHDHRDSSIADADSNSEPLTQRESLTNCQPFADCLTHPIGNPRHPDSG